MFHKSQTIIYYCNDYKLEINHLLKMCTDISIETKLIEKYNDKFFIADDKKLFEQICYLAGREILNITFIFPNIKCILLNSGLHGYLLAEKPIASDLKKSIASILNIKLL